MKSVIFIAAWLILTGMILQGLYAYTSPEMQYRVAEMFGYYGDESVMDFILSVYILIAVIASSLLCYCLIHLINKK